MPFCFARKFSSSSFTTVARGLICLLAITACLMVSAAANAESLTSPDGRIEVSVEIDQTDQYSRLVYQVKVAGEVVIKDSPISFLRSDDAVIGEHVTLASTSETTTHDKTWKPVYGERSSIRDHYRSRTFHLEDTQANCPLAVQFRCYDTGVAFCTTLGKENTELKLKEERTEFRFTSDYPAWRTTSAQGTYDKVPLNQLGKNVERPLVVEAGQHYVAIGEAKLVDYAVMRLRSAAGDAPGVVSQLLSEVTATAPLTTPWRVVLIADSPGQLLESNDLFLNLNDPCAIADTSWIKPGKVLREISLTTLGGKAAIDFAVKNNFQYVEFDAGWYGHEYDDASDATTITVDAKRSPGPLDLQEIIQYGKQRDIGILVYVNRRALEKQLDEILPLYKKWGIAGVKYGFVNTGSQKWTSWLHDAVRKAAEYELMVDIHDEYRPTGYSRTYPNLMTQEGVRGDEATPSTSLAVTTLFTRNLAGAADHTICYYDPRVKKNWSHAQQLAKAVCTYSPWQFIYWYDTPLTPLQDGKTTRNRILPSPELEFFAQVPTVWDETRVLQGDIGEYVVIARRSGSDWFVGAINANEKRELTVPLNFLDSGKSYQARIYRDDSTLKTRTQVAIDEQTVDAEETLTITLAPNEGEAMRMTPK